MGLNVLVIEIVVVAMPNGVVDFLFGPKVLEDTSLSPGERKVIEKYNKYIKNFTTPSRGEFDKFGNGRISEGPESFEIYSLEDVLLLASSLVKCAPFFSESLRFFLNCHRFNAMASLLESAVPVISDSSNEESSSPSKPNYIPPSLEDSDPSFFLFAEESNCSSLGAYARSHPSFNIHRIGKCKRRDGTSAQSPS